MLQCKIYYYVTFISYTLYVTIFLFLRLKDHLFFALTINYTIENVRPKNIFQDTKEVWKKL